jgi:hypothetical protein
VEKKENLKEKERKQKGEFVGSFMILVGTLSNENDKKTLISKKRKERLNQRVYLYLCL